MIHLISFNDTVHACNVWSSNQTPKGSFPNYSFFGWTQFLTDMGMNIGKVNESDHVDAKCTRCIHMGVSKNSGTTKSSILIGFSLINHPFWGTPIFGNTHSDSGKKLQRQTFRVTVSPLDSPKFGTANSAWFDSTSAFNDIWSAAGNATIATSKVKLIYLYHRIIAVFELKNHFQAYISPVIWPWIRFNAINHYVFKMWIGYLWAGAGFGLNMSKLIVTHTVAKGVKVPQDWTTVQSWHVFGMCSLFKAKQQIFSVQFCVGFCGFSPTLISLQKRTFFGDDIWCRQTRALSTSIKPDSCQQLLPSNDLKP